MNVIQILLLLVQGLISVGLIVLVMSHTSKNEGLTGTVGNNMPANFKGKPGFEERMQDWMRNLAIAWFVVGILVGIAFRGG
jgi:protein translocase SecG subunit